MINDTTTTSDPIVHLSFAISSGAFTLKWVVYSRDITALFNTDVYSSAVTLSGGYPDRLTTYYTRYTNAQNELTNKRSYTMAKTNVLAPTKYVYHLSNGGFYNY